MSTVRSRAARRAVKAANPRGAWPISTAKLPYCRFFLKLADSICRANLGEKTREIPCSRTAALSPGHSPSKRRTGGEPSVARPVHAPSRPMDTHRGYGSGAHGTDRRFVGTAGGVGTAEENG